MSTETSTQPAPPAYGLSTAESTPFGCLTLFLFTLCEIRNVSIRPSSSSRWGGVRSQDGLKQTRQTPKRGNWARRLGWVAGLGERS